MTFRAVNTLVSALALATLVAGPVRADEPYVMKISLPTINEQVHQYARELAAMVAKDSGGRIKPEVYPASQLGSIPRQIEGTQFGAIQCAIIPPEFFVGIDGRFGVMAAPGLVGSMDQAERVAHDPAVLKLILGLGADKGLHGGSLWAALPSYVISKSPIRHLDDFKGKKLRVLASDFQTKAFERIGATPVAMTLGDVLPAIQQGAIDGAVSGMTVFTSMSYQDAAKYVTDTGQPYIFIVTEYSAKWRASLPPDLRKIIDRDALAEAKAIVPVTEEFLANSRKEWVANGGELISLPPAEQSAMMATFSSVAADVAKNDPKIDAAYKLVSDAAKRDK
jgi:TRAP-type C4-dicarboxylate transport system substrate-binding protein